MNLLSENWIPIQRTRGTIEYVAPWQVTEPDNPIVALASPRHDFNAALAQFLIGLLQTAAAPADSRQWGQWLEQPPSPEELRARFSGFEHAFELDGPGPRFMQDYQNIEGERKPLSSLLIEAPGGRTTNLFLDHFVKDGGVRACCRACTATALFALQINAPSGGVGHRTSLRGGGPLTTLIVPDVAMSGTDALPDTLWTLLWLNVLDAKSVSRLSGNTALQGDEYIFPWLAPTMTSEKNTGTRVTPEHAHPLQMYWSMPRRIRVDWDGTHQGRCDLCGREQQTLVDGYVTKNYGVDYAGAWRHPLSPHYQNKQSGERLPMHAHQDGLIYRHWLSWTQSDERYLAAEIVAGYKSENDRKLDREQLRLWVFGYDMDNMKARGWHEKTFPLYFVEDEAWREEFCARVEQLLDLATRFAGFVQACVKEALFERPAESRGDAGMIKTAFYAQTESAFLNCVYLLKQQTSTNTGRAVLQTWHASLTTQALKLFEYWAETADFTRSNPKRIVAARAKLNNLMHGKKLIGSLGLEDMNREDVA